MIPAGIPGADFIELGMTDLRDADTTEASLLVSIGAPRLRQLGLDVPLTLPDPEHRLYAFLARRDPDSAHARCNALIRRLVSFERAYGSFRRALEDATSETA